MKNTLTSKTVLFLCLFWASILPGNALFDAVPNSCREVVNGVLRNYFAKIPLSEITISLLPGGHSNISLLITADNSRFVLRIKNEQTSLHDLKREVFAMQESARLNISPRIFYVSENYRAMLMEYIPVRTLSLEQSKLSENIIKIAQTLAKSHHMAANPYPSDTGVQTAIELYNSISSNFLIKSELDQAFELIRKYETALAKTNTYQTTIHNDLNPRNILLYGDQTLFIDWEYTGREDPFMDISYLALRLDYTTKEEMLFLESYLQKAPSESDIERYYLAKKLNYALLVIYFFYFSLREKAIERREWDRITPLKEYEYYVKTFVDQEDQDISLSQWYYDLAQWCLIRAKI